MAIFDTSKINIIPYVHLSDASLQDYSSHDSQFPGIYNDSSFIYAMADTEDGKRYELYRAFTKNVAFDFMVIECPKDIWADPAAVKFPGENDLYWGAIMWQNNDGVHTASPD